MADSFGAFFREQRQIDLGNQLLSWIYRPQKSNKFLFYTLGLVGALVIFLVAYGSDLLPWLDKVPEYALYIIFLLFGPAINLVRSFGKDQKWTLFERGFEVVYMEKNNRNVRSKIGHWHDYKTAEYTSDKVILIPVAAARRKITIRVAQNVMEVYSLCRERISMAQTLHLESKMRRPLTPNTPEQRKVAEMEKRMKRRT